MGKSEKIEAAGFCSRGVKILSIQRAIKRGELNDGRTGMFTTGIIAKVKGKGHDIALYLSGRNHAGENIEELLRRRQKSLGPPIQMSDAKSCNGPRTQTQTQTQTQR